MIDTKNEWPEMNMVGTILKRKIFMDFGHAQSFTTL